MSNTNNSNTANTYPGTDVPVAGVPVAGVPYGFASPNNSRTDLAEGATVYVTIIPADSTMGQMVGPLTVKRITSGWDNSKIAHFTCGWHGAELGPRGGVSSTFAGQGRTHRIDVVAEGHGAPIFYVPEPCDGTFDECDAAHGGECVDHPKAAPEPAPRRPLSTMTEAEIAEAEREAFVPPTESEIADYHEDCRIGELVSAVRKHSLAHYDDGAGWDYVEECWGDDDVERIIREADAKSTDEAIAAVASACGILAERCAEVRAAGDCDREVVTVGDVAAEVMADAEARDLCTAGDCDDNNSCTAGEPDLLGELLPSGSTSFAPGEPGDSPRGRADLRRGDVVRTLAGDATFVGPWSRDAEGFFVANVQRPDGKVLQVSCMGRAGVAVAPAFAPTQLAGAPKHINDDVRGCWATSNDDGFGFAVGDEGDSPRQAVEREGWYLLDTACDDGDEALAVDDEGRTVLVCDVNGPWGCYVD